MWYRKSNIHGEYWLTENGPEYAEGEDNHEAIAEGYMLQNLNNDIEDNSWGTQTYYNARNMFMDALENPNEHTGQLKDYIEALQKNYGNNWRDEADYDDYLVWLNTRHQDEVIRRIRQEWVQREIAGLKNPRLHMSKYYDWVRVQSNNIEVWEMNDLTRARIKKQLDQIYYDELGDFANELDDEWKAKPIFNLSILSTSQYIPGLSYYDLISHGEKKKEIETRFDFYPDYKTTKKRPSPVPGYQYEGG